MNTPTPTLPTGETLEREIEAIESREHDEKVRATIAERLKSADDPSTQFIPHETVFKEIGARLRNKLRGG